MKTEYRIQNTEYRASSPSETRKYVSRLAKQLKGGDIVGLIGPLGAGKTFIVQCLAKILGIKKRPRSPSFTLIQPYALPKAIRGIQTLVHVDAYRVTAPQLLEAGLEEYLGSPNTLVIIEWADRLTVHLKTPIKLLKINYGRHVNERVIKTNGDPLK